MFLELITTILATLLSIPLLLVGSECLAALVINKKASTYQNSVDNKFSYAVLVPAHNEESIIENTLTRLIRQLPNPSSSTIILIADNCTDNTANMARSVNGVTVLERNNTSARGKGYALDFGIQFLKKDNTPDIVIIMDADCETTQPALIELINTTTIRNLPVQMNYLMRPIENASVKQKIAGFAWLLKNQIRAFAMNAFGLPIILTGTGMAFPWKVFEAVTLNHGNIVEDLQLGIDCAANGYPPVFCHNAIIYSDFPEQSSAELSQRTRWEHGHLQTIIRDIPILIKKSWHQKNWRLFGLALDIAVPPLSLLILISLVALIIISAYSLISGNTIPLATLVISFSYFTAMLIGVWWRYGQAYLSTKELAGIPAYVFSKLGIYVAFIFKRQKDWVRTNRDTKSS